MATKITVARDKKNELFELSSRNSTGPSVAFGDWATVTYGEDIYLCRLMGPGSEPKVFRVVSMSEKDPSGNPVDVELVEADLMDEDEEEPQIIPGVDPIHGKIA